MSSQIISLARIDGKFINQNVLKKLDVNQIRQANFRGKQCNDMVFLDFWSMFSDETYSHLRGAVNRYN